MGSVLTFEELTEQVVSMAMGQTARSSIELGVIQGFCLDVAVDISPELVPLLSSVHGLDRLVLALEAMPDLIRPAAPDRALWTFVRGDDSI